MRQENYDSDCDQKFRPPFGLPEKQKEKRAEEMKNEQRKRDHPPATCDAMQIPRNFMGQIARPNHDELRVGKIRPQHREGEQEVPEVMKSFLAQNFS